MQNPFNLYMVHSNFFRFAEDPDKVVAASSPQHMGAHFKKTTADDCHAGWLLGNSLAELLHLLLQHPAKALLGDDLPVVQACFVVKPLPHLRRALHAFSAFSFLQRRTAVHMAIA